MRIRLVFETRSDTFYPGEVARMMTMLNASVTEIKGYPNMTLSRAPREKITFEW